MSHPTPLAPEPSACIAPTDPVPVHIPLAKNVAGLFMIAPPGAGKSSTFRCLSHLFGRGEMWFGDTSDALDEANADLDHPMREALLRADHDRRANRLVLSNVVMPVCALWAQTKLRQHRRTRIYGWSGWPRFPDQIPMTEQFGSHATIYLDVPQELALARCLKRFRETPTDKRRPDDPQTEDAIITAFRTKRYPDFIRNIDVILSKLGNRVIRVDGALSMVEQIVIILDGIAKLREHPEDHSSPSFLPTDMYDLAMRNLGDGSHPFYDEASKSSNPGPRPYVRETAPA